jgi:hypothetical protein
MKRARIKGCGGIEFKMCVLLLLQLLSETFHILRINKLGIFIKVLACVYSRRYSCQISMKL